MTITVDQLVQREVNCCLSPLVSTLAAGYGTGEIWTGQKSEAARELNSLCEQAYELACPTVDCEEGAIQDGWMQIAGAWTKKGVSETYASLDDLLDHQHIDPYEWEVFEHWAVSPWLAEKLAAQGEKVDADFAGLCVWARTTTGQGIASDSVIQRIHAELVKRSTLPYCSSAPAPPSV